MITTIKTFELPLVNKAEMLRYALTKNANQEIDSLATQCIKESDGKIKPIVCFDRFDITVCDKTVNFGSFSMQSKALSKLLYGCSEAIIFCATVGIEMDRLILKYSKIQPSKAVLMQGLGAERIEALCDEFCKHLEKTFCKTTTARFSPGYGDLSIENQKQIFQLLSCEKNVGVTLNDSMLMSPSKSVTAIVGLK